MEWTPASAGLCWKPLLWPASAELGPRWCYKLPDATEDEVERLILGESEMPELPTHGGIGNVRRAEHMVEEYVNFAVSTVNVDLRGKKIALDCANGASSVTSPAAFRRLGAQVLVINNDPDGININNGCGSTHIEGLQRFVVNNGCDLGFAFDGDADRVLAVDNKGGLIDGDVIMAVCGNYLKQRAYNLPRPQHHRRRVG